MPVRIYHNPKIGQNGGILFSGSSGAMSGCVSIIYWIFIGWWLRTFIWIIKTIIKVGKWVFTKLPGWFNVACGLVSRIFASAQIPLGDSEKTKIRNIKFITGGAIGLLICSCCLFSSLSNPTVESKNNTATPTIFLSTTHTDIPIPSLSPTPEPTPTFFFTKTTRPSQNPTIGKILATASNEKTQTPPKTITQTTAPTSKPRPTSTNVPATKQPPSRSIVIPTIDTGSSSQGCCKICGADSQPCGDSCISVNKTCHKGTGCACK